MPDLARLQAMARRYMTDTCDIYEPVPTVGPRGGRRFAYAPSATGVPCRIRPRGGGEQPVGERPSMVAEYHIHLPPGTAASGAARILGPGGVWYEVRADLTDVTYPYDTTLRCRRVEP